MAWPPKKCWYCGSKNLAPVKDWYQCQDCQATDTPPVKLGTLPINENPALLRPRDGKYGGTVYTPSPSVTRRAAAARKRKA